MLESAFNPERCSIRRFRKGGGGAGPGATLPEIGRTSVVPWSRAAVVGGSSTMAHAISLAVGFGRDRPISVRNAAPPPASNDPRRRDR